MYLTSLWGVTRATLIARISYAASAWWWFLSVAEKDCTESVIKKAQRYCLPSTVLKMHRVLLLIGLLWNLISSTVFFTRDLRSFVIRFDFESYVRFEVRFVLSRCQSSFVKKRLVVVKFAFGSKLSLQQHCLMRFMTELK